MAEAVAKKKGMLSQDGAAPKSLEWAWEDEVNPGTTGSWGVEDSGLSPHKLHWVVVKGFLTVTLFWVLFCAVGWFLKNCEMPQHLGGDFEGMKYQERCFRVLACPLFQCF